MSERSRVSSRTGRATACTERMPRAVSPRRARARRTRCTLSASCGRDRDRHDDGGADLVQGAGQARSSRLGLARALAAPMHAIMHGEPSALGDGAEQALEVDGRRAR